MRPKQPPIIHRLTKRRTDGKPERVNVHYREMRPDYREGPLNTMLAAIIVIVGLGAFALLQWGGPP